MYTASISLESQEERELLFAVKVPHILQYNIEGRHRMEQGNEMSPKLVKLKAMLKLVDA